MLAFVPQAVVSDSVAFSQSRMLKNTIHLTYREAFSRTCTYDVVR